MDHEPSLEEIKKEYHGSLSGYFIGLFTSLILTLGSFYLVWTHKFSVAALVYTIVGLGLAQSIVQLRYFMHLGKEEKPKWESISFYFMITCLIIIVVGTLWIMFDLNNRVMSGMKM